MATLPLTSLALVSTQRTVPLNGSPTSQDYNDDQNDGLIDLTSIVSFINGTLIPLLQVLPSLAATAGLEGRAINTDSTNLTALCFNALTSTPLTVAQSLNYLQNLQTNLQGQMTSLSTQVAVLSSQLSATNQNDISLALQNFQSVLNTTTATLNALQTAVNNNAATTAQVVTPSIAASSMASRCSAGASAVDSLCGGWAQGMNRTRERSNASSALCARMRWPMWTGLNVPPNMPILLPSSVFILW